MVNQTQDIIHQYYNYNYNDHLVYTLIYRVKSSIVLQSNRAIGSDIKGEVIKM